MSKRLFIGIPLSTDVTDEILQWEEYYKDLLPVRWIPPEQLHITLIAPWYTHDVHNVKRKLAYETFSVRPFEAVFRMVGYGPSTENARMVWAWGDVCEEMLTLKRELEKVLRLPVPIGNPKRKKEFRMHITLARFSHETYLSFEQAEIKDHVEWKLRVSTFVLYESHLQPSGVRYERLNEFQLPVESSL